MIISCSYNFLFVKLITFLLVWKISKFLVYILTKELYIHIIKNTIKALQLLITLQGFPMWMDRSLLAQIEPKYPHCLYSHRSICCFQLQNSLAVLESYDALLKILYLCHHGIRDISSHFFLSKHSVFPF